MVGLMETVNGQAPPGQACLVNLVLRGWVMVRGNQLVILTGMSQAKRRRDYSTQIKALQAVHVTGLSINIRFCIPHRRA
jgi:hypothetical protein